MIDLALPMRHSKGLFDKETAMIPSILPTYNRAPLSFVKGEGAWLIEADGRRFLDLGAGIAVNALGHGASLHLFTQPIMANAWAGLDATWHKLSQNAPALFGELMGILADELCVE